MNEEDLLNENFNLKNKIDELQNQFQAIFEQVSDGIFISNEKGDYIDVNQEGCRILGYTKEEILGKNIKELLIKEDLEEQPIKYDQLNSYKTLISRRKLLHKNGKIVSVEIKGKKLKNGNLIGIVKDITDYDVLSKKLKASEERFSKIFKLTPNALSIISMENGKVLEVNDEALKISDYSREELLSTPNLQNNLWADHSEKERLILKLSKEGYLKNEEVLVKSKSNKLYNCLLSSEFIELDSKMYVLNLLNDFTKQKQIQEKLNNERKNLKTLIETLPDLIWVKDINGVYLSCNNKFEKFIGYKESEIIGKTDYDFVERDLAEFFRENDRKALENNRSTTNLEWLTFASDGHKELVQTIKTPLYDYSNELVGVLGIARDITDLYEAQEKYKLIAENVDDVIWILDPIKMKFNYVSPSIEKLRGYTPEEVCKQSMEEVVTPESYKKLSEILPGRIKDFYENQVDLNSSEITEIYQPTKSGEIVTTEVVTKFILDKKTNSIQVLGVSRNITERKKIENEIKESNEKFHKIFNDSPLSNSIAELKTQKFIEINQKFLDMIKFTREEVIGKTSLDLELFYEKKERDIFFKLLNENHKISELKVKIKTKNNELLDCLIYSEIIKINNKEHIVSIIQNITEKLKTEQEIKRLSRLYLISSEINKILLKATNQNQVFEDICKIAVEFGNFRMAWIGLVDPENSIVKPVVYYGFEDNYLSIIPQISIKDIPEGRGPTGSSIREKKFFVNNDMENNSLMNPWKNEALKRGYRSSISIPIISNNKAIGAFTLYSDETYFFNEKEINLILEVNNSISYSIEIIEKEKIRKQNEEEINRLNVDLENRVRERTIQLENSNKDLEAFAYSVSHDLRAPLRHIDGFTNLLKVKLPIHNEESDKYIEKITNSSKKMSLMIDELLKFSRLGRKTLGKSIINLNSLINQIIEQYKPDYYNRNIKFEVKKLPEVLGDSILLQSVFQNIISNAIKFTSKKEEAIIKIGFIKKENKQIIYIKDNGAGFDMAYSDKLFGVFQRLHLESDFSGTGIGLANVKQIVNKHGWTIHAESEINKGSTFFITLNT